LSGKRAICAGPGNPPVVVDESADIDKAARDIILGGSTDNTIICTDEKETFAVASIADALIDSLARQNGVVLQANRLPHHERVIFAEMKGPRQKARLNKDLIGKNANVI